MNSQNLELIKVKIENEKYGLILNVKQKAMSTSEWQITKRGRQFCLCSCIDNMGQYAGKIKR